MQEQTTTETEITQEDVKQLQTQAKKKSLASRLSEFKALRGGRGGRKTQGVEIRHIDIGNPDGPVRVLMMPLRQAPKPKNDQTAQERAQAKRERKNQMRIQNAWRQSLGQTLSRSSGAPITFDEVVS